MSFLEIAGLGKRFGNTVALDDITLSVDQGAHVAVVGPSGSGKTTLLRIIAGFETPASGTVRLDGGLLIDGKSAVPTHQRSIGVVVQDGALFPHLTVRENIGFALLRRDHHQRARVLELLQLVELDGTLLERRPDQLSGGQQQRVALARALARRPKLMLLDEPFSALDTGLRASLRGAVANLLRSAGVTTILITHDQAEALSFADQVAVLRDGRLQQVGTPQQVYFRPRDRITAEFMGDCLVLPATAFGTLATCALGRVALPEIVNGPCSIMLRPEQINLQRVDNSSTADPVLRITEIDFAGRTSTVTVSLGDHRDASSLVLRGIASQGLRAGVAVGVTIAGPAHLF
jgi:iron(III) transport system ATP-binding protein